MENQLEIELKIERDIFILIHCKFSKCRINNRCYKIGETGSERIVRIGSVISKCIISILPSYYRCVKVINDTRHITEDKFVIIGVSYMQ